LQLSQPRQPAAPKEEAEMDEVGALVRRQLESAFGHPRMTRSTDKALRTCIGPLSDMAERMCPVVLEWTPEGPAVAYGPSGVRAGDLLVFMATPKSAVALSIDPAELRDMVAHAMALQAQHGFAPGEVWRQVAKAIEGDEHGFAFTASCSRFTPTSYETLVDQCRDIRQRGWTPALAVLAYRNQRRKLAAGISAVVALPSSLDLQIAEPQGAA
jgi:hypothetical protein